MTEEEAKRRWCPFARMVAGTVEDGRSSHDMRQHSYNRVASADAIALVTGASCIGSQCMAWRWDKKPNPAWAPETMMSVYPARNPYSRENEPFVYDDLHGRCGLAGQQ